ncbi:MAG: RNA polymerase sigma factor [Armatimonadetes bacterium]|nr:RNA polymerase sigma factor [Armatimonadota bacterium]MDE2206266.1 RNA polymerase sigma factor [Armatimonadota bacterium]
MPATKSDSGFEHRLILRLRGGDRAAWSTAFDLYGDRIYGYARRALGHREDAEDVAAETFQRAIERIGAFRGDSPLIAWLFAIARNLCLDRQRQPRLLGLELEEELADDTATEERLETRILVRQALERLTAEHRMVLLLCDVDQWDAKEVMVALNRSLASTKSMLYRARRNLRDRLAESGMGEECA